MPRKKKPSSDIDSTRCRNWTFLIYPDSAPSDWRSFLDDELCVEWLESPLHDRDVNPTGEPKKPHYHIVVLFGSVKSYDQVKNITDRLNTTIPKRVHNLKSMVRYFCHLDNPDKAQYERSGIVCHGGADIESVFLPSAAEELTYLKQIFLEIERRNIFEFSDLILLLISYSDDDLLQVVKLRHSLINNFICSLRNKKKPKEG